MVGDLQPATVVHQLKPAVEKFSAALPPDYTIAVGGTVEESGKGERPIAEVVPLMLFLMATVLMMQLQSFQKLFLVVSVAPLGLIGVVAALLITGQPLGFVAILGVLALIGIIIRNSVILVTQIDAFHAEGLAPWNAVVEATRHRLRPILLTAAAASLGMIPIAARGLLGPDGLRHDRRHRRRHAADAAVPAGALRRLVSHQGTGGGRGFPRLNYPSLLIFLSPLGERLGEGVNPKTVS